MSHLDTYFGMSDIQRQKSKSLLWPKRLWPTFSAVKVGFDKNQLELVSPEEKINLVKESSIHVITVVRNELIMLPHFLKHYRRLGISCFIMVDNLSDDGTREYLLKQPDVVLFSADTQYKKSHYGVTWQQAIMGNFSLGKWVLVADADELMVFPDYETQSFELFLRGIDAEGADCVRIDMIDMYPRGSLADADLTVMDPFEAAPMFDNQPLKKWCLGSGYFSNSESLVSSLRHRLAGDASPNMFTAQKFALFRYQPWIRLSEGLHCISGVNKVKSKLAWFAHFKYHAGFQMKALEEVQRKQHYDNAVEYSSYSSFVEKYDDCFYNEAVSVQFSGSKSFIALEDSECQ
jgi:hypothetical protein